MGADRYQTEADENGNSTTVAVDVVTIPPVAVAEAAIAVDKPECESCGKPDSQPTPFVDVIAHNGTGLTVCVTCEVALKQLGWEEVSPTETQPQPAAS
jgi:hypothetical protein